jgi:predicted ATPase/predicted nucleic-acid-binding protein
MKIKSLKISDYKPIKTLEISDLGNIIIIAGANGSGKTRLKQAIIASIQGNPVMDLTIEATRPEEEEEKYFNSKIIEVKKGIQNPTLNNYINTRKYGAGRYVGSLVQIDSNREVQTLKFGAVNWLGGDPDDVETVGNYYFSPFSNRWQDFVNYIHQKSASRDKKLADELKKRPDEGRSIMSENPDPFEKYKVIYSEILPGKELLDINPAQPKEFQYKDEHGQTLPFKTLSSGEQEVIKVLFDVARKEIKHSIIIVDEPELHLHPTLTFKLIESLKSIGEHTNQYIFLTHSADLISTYYATGNVFFINSDQSGENQAHRLSKLNESHFELVQLIGENLGLFAVGKKIIFVEGETSSIDRLSYHKIAQTINKEIRISPIGSVTNIGSLKDVEQQIRNSIFGVNLFMIRDRDGLSQTQIDSLEENGHIFCLKRRHLENYFLDEEILQKVVEHLYLNKDLNVLSEEIIRDAIKRIAHETIGFNLIKNFKDYLSANHSIKAPKISLKQEKTLDDYVNEIVNGFEDKFLILQGELNSVKNRAWLTQEKIRLEQLLTNDGWKTEFQGKIIFARLCGEVLKDELIRIRECYIDIALKEKPDIFKDIIEIMTKI